MRIFFLRFIALLLSGTLSIIPLLVCMFIGVYLTYPCSGMSFLEIWYSYMIWRFILTVVLFFFGVYSAGISLVNIFTYLEGKFDL